ncbi:MAG: helix-turn-helix transcriptional regulator [Ensifer adhaerens]|nr:helix-turn-helix transcriptional regulator [Ensifer adhaerens]
MLAPHAMADATDDTIGGRISLARDAIKLSIEEISAIAGVTEETWISWENDRAEPRANRLDMMAGILQVNLAWLLDGRGRGPVEARSSARTGRSARSGSAPAPPKVIVAVVAAAYLSPIGAETDPALLKPPR